MTIRFILARLLIQFLWLIRWALGAKGKTYLLLSAPQLQPFLAWVGRVRAFAVFEKARLTCPAYANLLAAEHYDAGKRWNFNDLPVMTKENYVKKYSLEERCYNGKIPAPGTVIDESSGSSGVPNNWVRSAAEREDVKRVLQLNYEIIFNDDCCLLLNCFALGPWATGMNVSMSLADVGILKSIGPDKQKLENTLQLFGTNYRYLIFGYPPFLKSWLDETQLDLSLYKIDALVGGEGMSEGLRSFFLRHFNSIVSSYGASDLEINIGVETELTIALRRRCFADKALSLKLFGRETPPMIFQYNAADYIIETNMEGELLFTINRFEGAAPKIRYNLRDSGGCLTHADLSVKLKLENVEIKDLTVRQSAFPLLYVHGRNDLSVPFYGAKIFPHDLEEIINTNPQLIGKINSFQLRSEESADLKRILQIHLEKSRHPNGEFPADADLQIIIFDELCRVNQDFREVTRMFERGQVEVYLHDFESDMFAGRDIRIKNKYIG